MKHLFMALLGVVAFYALPAWAYSCSTTPGTTTINISSLSVPRDAPIGTQIGPEFISSNVDPFSCTNSAPTLTFQEFGVKAYGTFSSNINGRRIYDTNIAGIGYAMGIQMLSNCRTIVYVDGTNTLDGNLNNRSTCSINGMFTSLTSVARIMFYKTASVTGSGTVIGKQVGSFILRNNQNSFQLPESAININSFNITALACSVGNASIIVPMGNIKTTAFSGVGSSPAVSNTQSFNIPLSCNTGTRVFMSLTGTAVNGAKGVLALDSAGSSGVAAGVGIQLLSNNAPVTFGTSIYTGTTSSSGVYNIPLQARYYQTAQNITAGRANSSATFTLTYP